MKLNNQVKEIIHKEFEAFKESMYAGKSLKERQELDQFFTPPEISIYMIERFTEDDEDSLQHLKGKKILDPTCGSGNLLAACIIAGAEPQNIYGNDYDKKMVELCKKRLNAVCDMLGLEHIPEENIHKGNALKSNALTNWNSRIREGQVAAEEKIEQIEAEQANMKEEELW